jgi:molybdenum cofactor cytidylyltransferase
VPHPPGPTALILAAGAGRRFGGRKLIAPLLGQPVLAHVLEAARSAGLHDRIVVLGADAEAVEVALTWQGERVVRNPDPDRGLSSSLRLGLGAMADDVDSIVVLLGDQPLVDPSVVRRLADEPLDPAKPFLVPRYPSGGSPNPVRVQRAAWSLADELEGDHGFGRIIADRPDLVRHVDVDGANPDIDTPADLAVAAWAAAVRSNRAQVERLREVPDGRDFYGPVSSLFVADPHRKDDPTLDAVLALARPDDRWLDIGAGAGRYALPLAIHVREVIAIDVSPSMLDNLRAAMIEHGIHNVRPFEGRWPFEPTTEEGLARAADVAMVAHVGYDIEWIGPFLDAMESAARRLCVSMMMNANPATVAAPFWPLVHGEERVPLPALPEFVALLTARGRAPEVRMIERQPRTFATRDEMERMVRRQLWVGEGTAKERRMRELLDAWSIEVEGGCQLRDQVPLEVGIVTWSPVG